MPHGARHECSECDDLLTAALSASKEYHNLLSDLEAAHIRGDASITFALLEQVNQSVVKRDNSITAARASLVMPQATIGTWINQFLAHHR